MNKLLKWENYFPSLDSGFVFAQFSKVNAQVYLSSRCFEYRAV